jgi:hypothetical protein
MARRLKGLEQQPVIMGNANPDFDSKKNNIQLK